MLVLGIETSCDESGVALYDTERGLLGHLLYSQVRLHAELVERAHPVATGYDGSPISFHAPRERPEA